MYGKGRVFYGSFSHAAATWDIRDVQQMYFEAIKWALGFTDAVLKPHPMTTSRERPVPLIRQRLDAAPDLLRSPTP